ncbi:MAG: hypothetical protein IPM95_10600 [Sphingobacteriales bacterium]|jgi:hypothetical protein|nr:hypothetical protein [Sphingobacteriales bacterium]
MKKYTLIAFLIFILSVSACKKDRINEFIDIYTTGYISLPDTIIDGIAVPERQVATVWKNDSLIILSDTSSEANAIFLQDDNMYVAGHFFPEGATYWINGIRQNLPTYRGYAAITTDIAAMSNLVYVSGYVARVSDSIYTAKLWRNGTEEVLANSTDAVANAVAINALGDIYVVGWKKIGNTINAVYWKNGQQFILGPGVANDIFIVNNTVYIGGHTYNNFGGQRAAYWKNNLISILENDLNSDVVAISFSDNVVFAAGRTNNDACYWRDGSRFQVQTSDTYNNSINGMATYGNSAFSAGSILINAEQKAYYWENRSKYILPAGTYDFWSEANDIAIKEK